MTIRERFAKYTTEELEKGIARLKEQVEEKERFMEEFKAERNLEMYEAARELRDTYFDTLVSAECALNGRR